MVYIEMFVSMFSILCAELLKINFYDKHSNRRNRSIKVLIAVYFLFHFTQVLTAVYSFVSVFPS